MLVTVIAQVALAVAQAPPQSARVLFGAGAAVKVTTVPEDTVRVQVAPQLIPAGLDVMVPVPFPAFALVRVTETGAAGAGGVSPLPSELQAPVATSNTRPAAKSMNLRPISMNFMMMPLG